MIRKRTWVGLALSILSLVFVMVDWRVAVSVAFVAIVIGVAGLMTGEDQ